MRTTSLILSIAALAGVALLLVRDGDERAGEKAARETNARIDLLEAQLGALARDVRALLEARTEEGPKLLTASSREQADIEALRQRVSALEARLVEIRAALAQQDARAQAAAPSPAKPAKKSAGKKPPADPAEVDLWLERLESASADVVFSSTIELARLGDLRATYPLMRILESHKDFYSRLGAATALGELQAVASVAALIESLNDKDELVRTASAEALKRITGKDFKFVSGLDEAGRQAIQDKCRAWWRDHEDEVAERLKQKR